MGEDQREYIAEEQGVSLAEEYEYPTCPICNKQYDGYPAISRKDNKTEICSQCGVDEAREQYDEDDLRISTDKELKKIIIYYKDGTTKEINKGFIMNMTGKDNEIEEYTFDMIHISGKDLNAVITGVLQLADKIGYFNDVKDGGNDV